MKLLCSKVESNQTTKEQFFEAPLPCHQFRTRRSLR